MKLPVIHNYGNYSSDNYGANSLRVTIGSLTIYFSYRTPVAFRAFGEFVIRENDWGSTTGKHLNWIDPDKSVRIPGEEFEKKFSKVLSKLGLEE